MYVPSNAPLKEAITYHLQLSTDQQEYLIKAIEDEDTFADAVQYAEEIKSEAGGLIDTVSQMIAQIQDIVDQIDKNTKKVDILSIVDDLNTCLGEIEQSFDNASDYFYEEANKNIKDISELRL